MTKTILASILILLALSVNSQALKERLNAAAKNLQQDAQMQHAILGLYVTDATTGEVIFDMNGQTGLAPASTQKLFTSSAALELLGKGYRYATTISYDGKINAGKLTGNVFITGSGDPTIASWRYAGRTENDFTDSLVYYFKKAGIKTIDGNIHGVDKWETQTIPGGWIWDDIGNYYGAGISALNWKENQYDLILKPGKAEGEPVEIVRTVPALYNVQFISELKTGPAGSGDNAYIYLAPGSHIAVVRGTVPPGNSFKISGSVVDPGGQFLSMVTTRLKENNIQITGSSLLNNKSSANTQPLLTYYSPGMDSIVYWFLQKSINLYGEALLKTIGLEKNGNASNDKGLNAVKAFWQDKGIDRSSLHIMDGSGLSPQNRVTPASEVSVLRYAKTRPWYDAFYAALPVFNKMKMKSGTIGGSKAFAGYQKDKAGREYSFSFIINNYDGSSATLVQKMYKVLDELKE
ncbi:MAG: D-alanyl-D-alanine carboxypeptidase [Chitinophagaceae bacterium]|nr:D-alanyl-D-alanine carboxypeptidase [Chitinophagaceae bacterium]